MDFFQYYNAGYNYRGPFIFGPQKPFFIYKLFVLKKQAVLRLEPKEKGRCREPVLTS
jgi:hypothetical protein